MASVEMNSSAGPSPTFWFHLRAWIRSIPRSALLSMVGPSVLLVVGYMGWRFYGANWLDRSFYGIQQESIHLPPIPKWVKTPIVDEVYQGGGLRRLSLLDDQAASAIAGAFDKHPWIRKTHRVQKMAGNQVMVNVEYRYPIAMVYCEMDNGNESESGRERYLPVDTEGVLLPTKDFLPVDVPSFIHIYAAPGIKFNEEFKIGAPLGDPRILDAIKLCHLIERYREPFKIDRVYVYSSMQTGKSRWLLEIETKGGPRILWGHAPGLESLGEPTVEFKLKQLAAIASDKNLWAQPKFDLTVAKVP